MISARFPLGALLLAAPFACQPTQPANDVAAPDGARSATPAASAAATVAPTSRATSAPTAAASAAPDARKAECDAGKTDACQALAQACEPYSAPECLPLWQKPCETPSAAIFLQCGTLAWSVIEGKGFPADLDRGLKMLEHLCDVMHGMSPCMELAAAYDKGSGGVPKDATKAAAAWARACDGKDGMHPVGCAELCDRLIAGNGIARDDARAVQACDFACNNGVEAKCGELAKLYAAGTGVKKDAKRAKELRARACGAGVKDACGK